ncbi:MAG: mechanosensitive ion channel family protein [Betaproteobacteria bacterium]|nr:mechanosensitive ion channel family protein [Betaproteobacteria bacterium]
MNEQLETINQLKSIALDAAVKFGPKVLVAILIIVAGSMVSKWAAKGLLKALRKFDLEPPVRDLIARIVRGLIIGLFAIMALQNLGVELLPLIAGLGVAGAGIALAMQGVLANIVAGLTIIFTRPYPVGEYIGIAGEEGGVESISLFSTVLNHSDRSRVVIPNRKIVGEILHNYGKIRQIDITVGVAYDSDIDHALATIREILAANPLVLSEPAAELGVAVLADSSVSIAIKPWVKVPGYGASTAQINKAVLETFRARKIVMPFPQREVRMLAA